MIMPKSLLVLLVLLSACTLSSAANDSQCSTGTTFTCPNCGGYEVSDCLDCDGFLSTDIQHDICIDRKLFQTKNTDPNDHSNHYHFLWNDLVGMVVWFLTAGVATACGVGGGGIYVPLGILLFQFAPKQASGLSQASIFGASLGGLFLNVRNTHPVTKIRHEPGVYNDEKNVTLQQDLTQQEEDLYEEEGGTFYTRPLINYDMALFLAPMEMAGAVLGVLVQKVLPNWLYLLIAGCVLSFTSYKTYKKYFATRAKERALQQQEEENNEEESDEEVEENEKELEEVEVELEEQQEETTNVLVEGVKTNVNPEKAASTGSDSASASEETSSSASLKKHQEEKETTTPDDEFLELRQEYLSRDARQYPREKIVALLVLWVGLFLLTLLKGGKGVSSLVGIECDSPWFAVLIVLQFAWIFGFALYYGRALYKKQFEYQQVSYPFLQDDPVWNFKSLRFYGVFTFIAGVVAGLIGIGGGMVLGPLMLVMGIHPRVSSATTATMIVLTSSSVAVIFVTSGLVPVSYAVFYFFVCLIGAYVGKRNIDGYVKRTGKASLLILILATIIAFATVGCFVILLTRLADKDWCLDGFNKFCDVSDEEGCPLEERVLNMLLSSMSGIGSV